MHHNPILTIRAAVFDSCSFLKIAAEFLGVGLQSSCKGGVVERRVRHLVSGRFGLWKKVRGER